LRHLPLGKLPYEILNARVLSRIVIDNSVLLPPKIGEDGAALKTSDEILIVASDPITGATEKAGWLSVHVNANDIAVHAARPKWFLATILLPRGASEEDLDKIMDGILMGLREVKACLVGGHTETATKVSEPIIVGTMIGEPIIKGRFITSGGAKPGDAILVTKGAGIEGSLILATDFKEILAKKVDHKILRKVLEFEKLISIIPDVSALLSIGIDNISAMHDATEGGVLGAIFELAEASQCGFIVYEDLFPIRPETKEICEALGINPLKLISSGTLVATVNKDVTEEAIRSLKKAGIESAIVGEIIEDRNKRILVDRRGNENQLYKPPIDELWLLYEKLSIAFER